MTQLSVNVNKIALLRNSRGNDYPNLLTMARMALNAGATGITVHPRPDARHITYADVHELAEFIKPQTGIEFNVEGYPSGEFLELIKSVRPDQCTLVPDAPEQLTSNHGWQLSSCQELQAICSELKANKVRTSLFVEPIAANMLEFAQTGAAHIELYTEEYAKSFASDNQAKVLEKYQQSAKAAVAAGLGVNAGHDLNLDNIETLLRGLQAVGATVFEVSIGHAIMVESFSYGYAETIKRYLDIINTI